MLWSSPEKKAATHLKKADSLFARSQFRKAYEHYKKSIFFNADQPEVYKKLLDVMDKFHDDWEENDFVENVYWAMRHKEHIDPTFKRIHFRNEPEFKEVTNLIQTMLKAKDPQDETKAVEEIVEYGEIALYPLIEYILTFKNINQILKKKSDESQSD